MSPSRSTARGTTRIKICGITREEDARAATQAGADALGLNFYAPSPRSIDLESARRIVAAVPPCLSMNRQILCIVSSITLPSTPCSSTAARCPNIVPSLVGRG